MANIDIMHAIRIIAIKPLDCHLLDGIETIILISAHH